MLFACQRHVKGVLNMKPTDPRILTVLNVKTARGKHSPLYHWMREHHDALQAEFNLHGPQWAERAVAMGDAGLTDQTGKRPSVRNAMQTWYRVCEDLKGKGRRKRGKLLASKTTLEAPPTQKTSNQILPVITIEADEPEEEEFKLVFAGGPKVFTKKDSNDV